MQKIKDKSKKIKINCLYKICFKIYKLLVKLLFVY